ncbi:MAG: hypothetical protein OXF27_12145 [Acidobacteria bacterium]|nr:hypothetical protein [Acidobacteriota bacterium]
MISTASMGTALAFAQRDLILVVADARYLPGALALDLGSRRGPGARARHGAAQQVGKRNAGRLGLRAPSGELGLRHAQVELRGAAVSHQRTGRGVRGAAPARGPEKGS